MVASAGSPRGRPAACSGNLARALQPSQPDVPHGRFRPPRGDSERLRQVDLDSSVDLLPGDVLIDDLLLVEPGLDLCGGDLDPDVVPTAVVEADALAGLVLRRIHPVDAGEADDRTAPATEDERTERI